MDHNMKQVANQLPSLNESH